MKKQLPLLVGFLAGFAALAEYYLPAKIVREGMTKLLEVAGVLAAAAYVLGGINVIQVNVPIIQRRREDWPYKIVLIGLAVATLIAGIGWGGGGEAAGIVSYEAVPAAVAPDAPATLRLSTTRDDALLSLDDHPFEAVGRDGALTVPPGEHTVALRARSTGYADYKISVKLAAGQTTTVVADLRMTWGISGRVYTWLYDHLFAPCNATMFALLAFFIASAAFRAFRARNVDAALLLGAAILIMIGLVPLGRAISPFFPTLAQWIIDIPNNAGRRAIMMGAALGAIATSLRVILGIERSHLGRD